MSLPIDPEEIRALLHIIDESEAAEFSLEAEGLKIRIKKASAFNSRVVQLPGTIGFAGAAVQGTTGESEQEQAPGAGEQQQLAENHVTISAPMVGTFYRAPSPDAEPFVEVGDVVEPGQTLCIIEAMKLMNEIESDVRGRMVDILVENAEAVEYGQPLFIIEKL